MFTFHVFIEEDIVVVQVQLKIVHLVVGHVEHDIYKRIIRDKLTTCI